MTRICENPVCGNTFDGPNPRRRFCCDDCRWEAWDREHPRIDSDDRTTVETHVLDEARGRVEEGKTAADWALIAREHTMRTLLATGYFTADDLEPLGIPEHYRRSVHGLVTAYFRGPQPYMEEAGRRKSERPERKGGKNTIFRVSAKGRRELPKLLEDTRKEIAGLGAEGEGFQSSSGALSIEPGESPAPDKSRDPSACAASVVPPAVEGSGQLFELEQARKRPRSAITDPDWDAAA